MVCRQSRDDGTDETETAYLRNDEVSVLAYPAKSCPPSPVTVEKGNGVTTKLDGIGGKTVRRQRIHQLTEAVTHDIVIVLTVGIIRKLVLGRRKAFYRIVVEGNDENTPGTREEQTWVETFVLVIRHIMHLCMVVLSYPSMKSLSIQAFHRISRSNATGTEAKFFGSLLEDGITDGRNHRRKGLKRNYFRCRLHDWFSSKTRKA